MTGPLRAGSLGLGRGVVLWFVAAGIVMPAWLSLLGIPATILNLSPTGFVGHALWGLVLGVAYREIGLRGNRTSVTEGWLSRPFGSMQRGLPRG